MPAQHKAAVLPESGAQHVVEDVDTYSPKPNELLLKVTATAINPVDWKIRDYKLPFVEKYPAVLGSDAAGVVEEVGSDVSGFNKGDRVFWQGVLGQNDKTTFQQYAIVDAKLASKSPSKSTDEELSGVQLASIAAVTGLYHKTGLDIKPAPWSEGGPTFGKGKALVVLGGSSSVGQYVVQLARLSGFEQIVTASSAAHHDHLEKLGATAVLDRNKAKAEDYVAASKGLPIYGVYDSISAPETIELGIRIVSHSDAKSETKTVVLVLWPSDKDKELAAKHGAKVQHIIGIGASPEVRYVSEPFVAAVGGEQGWIAKGKFEPNRVRLVKGGLPALEEALALNKKGVSGEKVVIRPFDA